MTRLHHILPLALLVVALSSCDHATIYSEVRDLPLDGWQVDSALCFDVNLSDTASAYDIIVYVRHTDNYPYQNMWLIVEHDYLQTLFADSTMTTQHVSMVDTIEFYLADQRGRWLGNGAGSTHEMPVLFADNYHFPADSVHHFAIRHAMRETSLRGVTNVGLRVSRND